MAFITLKMSNMSKLWCRYILNIPTWDLLYFHTKQTNPWYLKANSSWREVFHGFYQQDYAKISNFTITSRHGIPKKPWREMLSTKFSCGVLGVGKRTKSHWWINELITWLIHSVRGLTTILHILQRCSLFPSCFALWSITQSTDSLKARADVGPDSTKPTRVSRITKNLEKEIPQVRDFFFSPCWN